MNTDQIYSLRDRVAVVLGSGGGLGSALAMGLGSQGARVAVVGRNAERLEPVAAAICRRGSESRAYIADAGEDSSLVECRDAILGHFRRIDILVNAVGGNTEAATAGSGRTFFDLKTEDIQRVMEWNILAGALAPCKVFGGIMARNAHGGSIINISSMAASRPLTRVVGYSAAKAAVENFTKWLAVHVAQEFTPKLRVNAIAPGFFLTEQNRFLLQDEKGELTERGKQILAHTPIGEFGKPEDLVGAAVWLASDASRFVTGTVVVVDGGFSAYAGV